MAYANSYTQERILPLVASPYLYKPCWRYGFGLSAELMFFKDLQEKPGKMEYAMENTKVL
jgi:hypothetical protein